MNVGLLKGGLITILVLSIIGFITTVSVYATSGGTTFVILALFCALQIILTPFALINVEKYNKEQEKLKKRLMHVIAGLGFFTGLIGGILVLVGISNAKERLHSRDDYGPRRDDYSDRDSRSEQWEDDAPSRKDDYPRRR